VDQLQSLSHPVYPDINTIFVSGIWHLASGIWHLASGIQHQPAKEYCPFEKKRSMITFEEAYNLVMAQAVTLPAERVGMMEALDRVLAEDIVTDMDMPPFDKSAVDGYACRFEDTGKPMEVIEVIPAGKIPEAKIESGKCAKIMTGAMLPEGADGVVMVEDTETMPGNSIRFVKEKSNTNICYRGEDIRSGDKLIDKGTLVQPRHIAVLAMAGAINPGVYRKVRIGVFSSGDELVEPESRPAPAQIRNSNAYQLMAQAQKAGALVSYFGIASDDPGNLLEKIWKASLDNDVVLLSGGVSMGDFDFVPGVMQNAGFEILFKSIAVQPGRPTVFARAGDSYIFGLPGNPVSSFVLFEILVKPFIMRLMGCHREAAVLILPMGVDYQRKLSQRKSFIPVKIDDGQLFPVEYHGSAHINAYTAADGIIEIERGETIVRKGALVSVRQV
jgi:molybdopterin molybdotransferase